MTSHGRTLMPTFSDPPTLDELAAYAAELYGRMHQAKHVPFIKVTVAGAPAKKNNCHENANIWIEENPSFSCVRGWLCLDGGSLSHNVLFLAHSVVADESGELYDVTPGESREPRPFLPACISEDDFAYVVEVLTNQTGAGTLVHNK